ncbi:DEAD/DEAH box helicase [Candidatus Woesearchaeota archaeon]|nr:DEAD/DEAH box helicase [Candidatus Woesearchaeota archaeon]
MITRKEKPNSEQELKRILNPLVVKWFFSRFKEFSLPQLFGVMEIHSRSNVLVSAPTGATKSLTAFLSILNELVDSAEKGILEDKVYCVYISPLKALNSDIAVNLIQPLKEIETLAGKELGIRVAVRTGDTSSSEKQKMLKKVPHILITTPESLAICLVSPKFKNLLHDIDWAIIDEVHSIAENKRGVDLSLSLERLQHSSPAMCRVGLSATIEPLEEIAKFLVGNERPCKIIDVQFIKKLDLKVISPVNDLINVTWNELEKRTYEVLNELIQQHKTTLIFTNTRAATERVVHNLKTKFGKKYYEISEEPPYAKSSLIGAHHGSLSKDVRFAIEQQLREGKLKCVVSSTSLELGLDIGYVDLVILLDSPKSVARALQRCLTFDMRVLCEDGTYQKIGEIVENKLDIKVISYDKNKGYIANKVKIWHKNKAKKIFNIALGCGENLKCTGEHPLLTSYGWKKARELNKGDLIAEIKDKINFQNSIPYLFELMPKDKIFVINIENFFQKQIDEYLEHNKISVKSFAKIIGMPYSRLIDCRRIKGRKKSIRLDHFLKVCDICNIPMRNFLPYLQYLKTKGRKWAIFPLKPTKEIMWLAGVVATDGCIVKSKDKQTSTDYYKIKIGNKSKLLIDRVKEIISKFDIVPYVSIRDGSFYNLEFGSNLFAHLFESFGIPSKNKSFALDVNDNLYSFSPDLIYSYLGGIFEGDGNFNEAGMVRIFTASKKFALGLHFLLSRLGYSNKVSRNKIKPSKLVKKVSNGYIYCVGIYNKNDLKRFFQNIPIYAEKSKRGELFTNNYEFITRCKSEKFLSYSKIKSINVINKKVNVYNLTLEEEPNNFIVGNVIVHNCGRAGHRLHDTTKGRIVVLDRDNLVECSVLLKNIIFTFLKIAWMF